MLLVSQLQNAAQSLIDSAPQDHAFPEVCTSVYKFGSTLSMNSDHCLSSGLLKPMGLGACVCFSKARAAY